MKGDGLGEVVEFFKSSLVVIQRSKSGDDGIVVVFVGIGEFFGVDSFEDLDGFLVILFVVEIIGDFSGELIGFGGLVGLIEGADLVFDGLDGFFDEAGVLIGGFKVGKEFGLDLFGGFGGSDGGIKGFAEEKESDAGSGEDEDGDNCGDATIGFGAEEGVLFDGGGGAVEGGLDGVLEVLEMGFSGGELFGGSFFGFNGLFGEVAVFDGGFDADVGGAEVKIWLFGGGV